MAKSILVVDDSRTIQTAIQMTFAAEDVTLTMVSDGEIAVQKAREGNFQVVLCDHMMPGMDGYAICEALKRDSRTAHLPFLLLTGSSKPFDEAKAQSAGVDDHIAKPFDSQALIDKTMALANKPQTAARSTAVMTSLAPKAPEPNPFAVPTPAPDPFGATMIDPFAPPPSADPFAPPADNNPFASPFAAPVSPFGAPPASYSPPTPAPQPPAPSPFRAPPTPQPPAAPVPSPFAAPPNPMASPQARSSIVFGGNNQGSNEDDDIKPTATLLGIPALKLGAKAEAPRPPHQPTAPVQIPVATPKPVTQTPPPITAKPLQPASPFASPQASPFGNPQAKPTAPVPPSFPKPPTSPAVPPKPPVPVAQPVRPAIPAAQPPRPSPPATPQPRVESTMVAAPPVQTPARAEPSPFSQPLTPKPLPALAPPPAAEPPAVAAPKTTAPAVATPRATAPAVDAPAAPAATPAEPSTPAVTSAPATNGAVTEDVLRQVLSQASREMIEKIVWEIIPDLAESIIREELEKIMKRARQ